MAELVGLAGEISKSIARNMQNVDEGLWNS